MTKATAIALLVAMGSGVASAQITLPPLAGAERMLEEEEAFARYDLPIAPFADGTLPTTMIEGRIQRDVFVFPDRADPPLDLLRPISTMLLDAGFITVLDCAAAECGGFDFRFAIDVVPEPKMHVDFSDYHFISMREPSGLSFLTLLASRTRDTGYIQITQIDTTADAPVLVLDVTPEPISTAQRGTTDLSVTEQLDRYGVAVLEDLEFASGSSDLTDGEFLSLTELAAFLSTDAARSVVLVGHTDARGSLENNIALSERRAEAVLQRLTDALGVRAEQITATGIGYLSPRASNASEDGRTVNRRVEVVLVSP